MTKKITLTTVIFFLFSILSIAADNDTDDNEIENDEDITIIVTNPTTNPTVRPKAPSRQRIDCHYTNGILYIQFALSEGICELTVIDTKTGDSQVYYFDSTVGAFINIGNLTSFEIYISTEIGNSYFGNKY